MPDIPCTVDGTNHMVVSVWGVSIFFIIYPPTFILLLKASHVKFTCINHFATSLITLIVNCKEFFDYSRNEMLIFIFN